MLSGLDDDGPEWGAKTLQRSLIPASAGCSQVEHAKRSTFQAPRPWAPTVHIRRVTCDSASTIGRTCERIRVACPVTPWVYSTISPTA